MRLSPLIQLSYGLQQYIGSQNAQIVRRQGAVAGEQLAVAAYFATDIFVPNRIRCQRICPLKTVVLAQMVILLPQFADLNESEHHLCLLFLYYMVSKSKSLSM